MCIPQGDRAATESGSEGEFQARWSKEELERLAHERPAEVFRRGPGRESFPWQSASGECWVVKRYRGGPGLEGWRERLGGRTARTAGRREFEIIEALTGLGLPVPRAQTCYEVDQPEVVSLVVMEHVPHQETLRERLEASPEEATAWFAELLDIVVRLHGAGWYHRDLYMDHFLIASASESGSETARERLVLIDVGRARCDARPRERWFVKDMAALWHSARAHVPPSLALRFFLRWFRSRGSTNSAARGRFLRAVLAKERRMAAHEPKGGTSLPRNSPEPPS